MNLNKKGEIDILYGNSNVLMQNGMQKICSSEGINDFHQAFSYRQFISLNERNNYDVIIIDWSNNNSFTESEIQAISSNINSAKILIISDTAEELSILRVLEQGIHGFLTYTCDEDEIIHAIFSIYKGDKFYCNKVLDLVLNKHLYSKEIENCEPTNLSKRETEVAALLANGLTNKEAANQLNISPHTVHSHRKSIMKKLNVRSAVELAMACVRLGIIKT